jgi:hypothetical protein
MVGKHRRPVYQTYSVLVDLNKPDGSVRAYTVVAKDVKRAVDRIAAWCLKQRDGRKVIDVQEVTY